MATNDSLWHTLTPAQVCEQLQSDPERGLSQSEVAQRRHLGGANRLPPAPQRSPLQRLGSQFQNLLIQILLIAALITALLQHWLDSGVILGVVMINALVGFLQEGKAERALAAIGQLLPNRASVIRDGERCTIDASELVVGDLVLLSAGDRVPADLRLVQQYGLRIAEAALTGESLPVDKAIGVNAATAPLGDRRSLAYSGTWVSYGSGRGVVVAIGRATEMGHISHLLASVTPLTTPLLRQLTHFGERLSYAIVAIALITFTIGIGWRDYSSEAMFLAAVGLAVAAIPEGLPAIITITLAIGVQRMAARQALIRRLPAVESLGAVSVICSDKTGTLTRNEMTVQQLVTARGRVNVTGSGYAPNGHFAVAEAQPSLMKMSLHESGDAALLELCRAALLCNDAQLQPLNDSDEWQLQGDPTDGALLTLALKAGLDPVRLREQLPRSDAIPFDATHQFMATLHHDHAGHHFILLKGAPERVFAICHQQHGSGEDRPPLDLRYWHTALAQMAHYGLRVLALALRVPDQPLTGLQFRDVEGGFTLLGLVGMIDPPREGVEAALAACRSAGIRVKMITGDHRITAEAIGEQLGIVGAGGRAITGVELAQLSETALQQTVRDYDLFARTTPADKLRLVTALQQQGAVVAMTGDGVNDAPALRRADVGVAMGRNGTEVAREAAEMVLTDDNFASIVAAVAEGRTVYDNIRKAILFILPTNGGEALIIVAAILLGTLLPITPLQILWVNMITAVTLALALAFEPAEADRMARPPRAADAPLLSGMLLWRTLLVSLLLVMGVFGLFLWQRAHAVELAEARTVAVNLLVLFEVVYLLNSRSLLGSALRRDLLTRNRTIPLAILLVLLLQLLFTYAPPLQQLFATTPLPLTAWLMMLPLLLLLFLFVELDKWWWRCHRSRSG